MAAIFIIIIVGLRREVGGDWYNYLDVFHHIKTVDFWRGLRTTEPGYAMLNIIAARAGWGIWFPDLVCAAIFTWGLIALSRMQPNPLLALAVSIYVITLVAMGYTRQSAALGFVILAVVQFLRGSTLRAFAFLLFASLFHLSSVIVAPLLGLVIVRRGPIAILLFGIIAVYMYLQLSGKIVQKIDVYTENTYSAGGALIRASLSTAPAALFLLFRNRFTVNNDEMRLLVVLSIVSLALIPATLYLKSTIIVDRISFYLVPLQIIVLSRIPYAFGARSRASMLLVTAVLFYSLCIEVGWLMLGTWGSAWLPYRNYILDWSSPRPREGPRWRQ